MSRRFLKRASAVAMALAMTGVSAIPAQAAGVGNVDIAKDIVTLGIGESTVIAVDYSDIEGGFADLAVVTSDGTIAVPALFDAGNQKANLAIGAVGTGTTAIAVYRVSNPAVVDYIAVQSGLAQKDEIITQVNGTNLTTIYHDRIIDYPAVLTGKNGAQLAVAGLVTERESGRDCLKVTGGLIAKDSQITGMNVFYANFYDAMGGLMKRQAVYSRNPGANGVLEIEWYIPEGCTSIVLE